VLIHQRPRKQALKRVIVICLKVIPTSETPDNEPPSQLVWKIKKIEEKDDNHDLTYLINKVAHSAELSDIFMFILSRLPPAR